MLSILFLSGLSFIQVTGQDIFDDVYFKPGDEQKTQNLRQNTRTTSTSRPNFKNGAKEIVFLDSRQSKDIVLSGDSIYILAEINDSIINETTDNEVNEEEGYYLDGFRGSELDFEYAERIRRFHNPKFTIHISDPQFTDIYFLDNYNWNVYVDGSYAWVTPTWTNPAWWNYYWTPHSYSSWFWRSSWFSPWGFHNHWYGYPGYGLGFGWNSFYGGFHPFYGGHWGAGMFGYGYHPFHHYSWYNPWYNPFGTGSWGHSNRKQNYSENVRRNYSGFANSSSANARISGGSQAVPGSSRTAAIYSLNGERNRNHASRNAYSSARTEVDPGNGRMVTTLRNTRIPNNISAGSEIRTRTTNTIRNTNNGNLVDERLNHVQGQRNRDNIQINRSSLNTSPTVRSQVENNRRSTSGTVVRSGSGSSPVRSSSINQGSSSRSSEQVRNTYSTSPRSTYSAPSSSSYSSGSSVRSSSPSFSSPSSSGSSSGGGGSRSSGGGSTSGGGRR